MIKGLIAAVILSSAASAYAAPTSKVIREYHPLEASRTLLVQQDYVLAGRSGWGGATVGVEVIDAETLELKQVVATPHVVSTLERIDDCRVMAMGAEGYTDINLCGEIRSSSYRFGINFVPHSGVPLGGDRFAFTEPNGGLIEYRRGRATRRIGDHVSLTVGMREHNGELWISNYAELTVVNPRNGQRRVAVPRSPELYGIKYMAPVGRAMVATVRDDKAVLVIDSATKAVLKQLPMKGEPEGIVSLGRCAVIADSARKTIVFVEIDGANSRVLGEWDASSAGDRLKYPAIVAVDEARQRVFLRSSYPCPTCTATQSSLALVGDGERDLFTGCAAAATAAK